MNSMRVDVFRSTAQRLGIPVSQLQTHCKVQGWQGAPKGLLQVLWERGFIYSKMWRHYHRSVLDDNNEMVEELSLEHLMSGCRDFINQVSQLNMSVSSFVLELCSQQNIMQKWLVRQLNILGHTAKIYTGERL